MKRVGVDAHVLTGKYQGSRTYLENILREIGRQDKSNRYVIFSNAPEETRALLPYENFVHVRIGLSTAVLRLLFYWPWARCRYRLDLLLTQYICPPLYLGPQLLIVHDLLFESHPQFFPGFMRFRLKLLCRYSASRALAIFTVSQYSREQIVARYGIPENRVLVTPNGARKAVPEFMNPNDDIQNSHPYFLYVGRLEPRKNLELLLRAFEKARLHGAKLVIVGREDFGCGAIADSLASKPDIVHVRDVDDEQLGRLYSGALGFIFPSFGEGFGIPVLEALSYGVPVIASNQTAIPEAGGDLANYFDPTAENAEEQLVQYLKDLINHPYRVPGDIVRKHLANFNWEASAATVVKTINSA